jgi:hypothetical protein
MVRGLMVWLRTRDGHWYEPKATFAWAQAWPDDRRSHVVEQLTDDVFDAWFQVSCVDSVFATLVKTLLLL